ncbi:MAG: GYD domain-containing protein [Kiloniellales bacterium]
MPTYISLMIYTDQGLRDIKKSPGRLDAARKAADDLGGKFGQLYLTMGAYDLVAISEFPDDATAATFALRLGALGNVRTTTVKAFPENAFRKILEAV